MERQRGAVGKATSGSVFGCMGIACSMQGKPMHSVCEKQDQEPLLKGVPVGFGSDSEI